MKIFTTLLYLSFTLILISCGERPADISGAKSYKNKSLSFKYPGNWTVTGDSDFEDFQNLFIETSSEGIVILQAFPLENAQSHEDFAKAFSASTIDSMPIGNIVDSKFEINESTSPNKINETFSIELFSEKIPHIRKYVLKDFPKQRCFLILQITSKDEAKAIKGFELIQSSLKFVN